MKNCLRCDYPIAGRIDKKFCSDGCRSAFNIASKRHVEAELRKVNNRLKRNYRILTELNTGQKIVASEKNLLAKGFDFEFFTQVRESAQGITCYYLYDQGYFALSDGSYVLIKKDSS